jgi:aryl sulfotransferase
VDALVFSPKAKYLYIGRDGRDVVWSLYNHHANANRAWYEALKRDMPGQMRRIAQFLEIPIDESRWDAIVEYCSFDWMKANATKSTPLGGAFWDGGAATFINKGTNGRWREILTADESNAYEERARRELGEECAQWLATGEVPA